MENVLGTQPCYFLLIAPVLTCNTLSKWLPWKALLAWSFVLTFMVLQRWTLLVLMFPCFLHLEPLSSQCSKKPIIFIIIIGNLRKSHTQCVTLYFVVMKRSYTKNQTKKGEHNSSTSTGCFEPHTDYLIDQIWSLKIQFNVFETFKHTV